MTTIEKKKNVITLMMIGTVKKMREKEGRGTSV